MFYGIEPNFDMGGFSLFITDVIIQIYLEYTFLN